MVHRCCTLILQWCTKWRCVGTICAYIWEPEAPRNSPTRNIRSQQGAIIIQAVKLLFCMFNFNAHTITHKKIEFLGSEMVQNLLSVTVLSPALQNVIITKHDFFPVFIALGTIATTPPPNQTLAPSLSLAQFNFKSFSINLVLLT